MAVSTISETHFTKQVKHLLEKLYGRSPLKDSLLDRAILFYKDQPFHQQKLDKLTEKITELKSKNQNEKISRQLSVIEREYRDLKQEFSSESHERSKFLYVLCREIIELSEGSSFAESNRKSAQLLGTIQLLNPTQGKKVAEANEKSKPLYKAILCLRLLDKLSIDGTTILELPYIKAYTQDIDAPQFKDFQSIDPQAYADYIEYVKIPILMAALVQDIGHFHPDAQKIVCGIDGTKNPYRMLELDDRKKLLQINYHETVKFLVDGIGTPNYVGNSKVDRDKFNINEHKKLIFIRNLLKQGISPKQGIGNLLKVPQIYASIILSTKGSYDYKLLPRVYQALNQNAERGTCSQVAVDALREITGDFPQGFGITYIPQDDGVKTDRYEYAIVTQLYPSETNQPICRTATRNLTFIGYGQDITINSDCNLYHAETAKGFANISKERLNEILALLSSNYHERRELDLLPRCWHAGEYFSIKDNQKLWNKQG